MNPADAAATSAATAAHRPLAGIRVLDASRYLPGPFCSLQLAWLGAEVTLLEQPPHGDPLRAMPPLAPDGVSLAYHSLRRGMRVELLDLDDAAGRERALELADAADVFIESFRPGVAARLGLGAAELRARNAGLVYCSISGYGQDGPWAQAPGHDNGYEAAAGLLQQSGTADEVTLPPVPLADLAGGMVASTAICAALARRAGACAGAGEGEGCELDVSLTEAALALQAMHLPGAGAGTGSGEQGVERAGGMLTGALASYRPYRCADGGWLAVGPIEPKFFHVLCEQLGRPELAARQYDLDEAAQTALRGELEQVFAARPAREWEQLLVGADGGGSCVVRALHPSEVHEHPQLAARGAVRELPEAPGAHMPASPYVIDGVRSDAPM